MLARADQRAAVHHVRGPAQGRRRRGRCYEQTYIKPWFIQQMKELVELEEEILKHKGRQLPDELLDPGQEGRLRRPVPGQAARACRRRRSASGARRSGVVEGWDAVPVSGVENAAYYYSTYNAPDSVAGQPTDARSWSSAAGRTASARASSSTTAACTRPSPCATRAIEIDHGQLQPGDRLHRLRHLGQALLRAADGRGRAEHLREGEAGGRDRPVRRPDAAEHRRASWRRPGVKILGHDARDDRPGRGPRPLPPDDGASWASRMPESGMASTLEEALAGRRSGSAIR